MTTINLPAGIHGVYYPASGVGTHYAQAEGVSIMYGNHAIARVVPRFPVGFQRLEPGEIESGYSYTKDEENEIAEYTVAKILSLAFREFNAND